MPVKNEPLPQYDPVPSLSEDSLGHVKLLLLALTLAALPRIVAAEDEEWHDRLEPTGSFRIRFDSARMQGEFRVPSTSPVSSTTRSVSDPSFLEAG